MSSFLKSWVAQRINSVKAGDGGAEEKKVQSFGLRLASRLEAAKAVRAQITSQIARQARRFI